MSTSIILAWMLACALFHKCSDSHDRADENSIYKTHSLNVLWRFQARSLLGQGIDLNPGYLCNSKEIRFL